MECPVCGCEKINVVRVWRHRKINDRGEHVYSPLSDLRQVMCEECDTVFVTQSKIEYAEVYDEKTMKKKIIKPQEITKRIERDAQTQLF